jgi:hypothetical protein
LDHAPPGYLLTTHPDQIDAGRFERLLADASRIAEDRPLAARKILDEALELWRGRPWSSSPDDLRHGRGHGWMSCSWWRWNDGSTSICTGTPAELVGQLRAFDDLTRCASGREHS